MSRSSIVRIAGLALLLALSACSTAPKGEAAKADLRANAEKAIAIFRQSSPAVMADHFDHAAGYAVFPTVAKGGLIVGGAHGRGILYERGRPIGYTDLTQGSIGAQIGGQGYRELIFFATPEALREFKAGKFALAAQASAVVVEAGAATAADYRDGVAIYTMPKAGAMLEASVGGQNFSYEPM